MSKFSRSGNGRLPKLVSAVAITWASLAGQGMVGCQNCKRLILKFAVSLAGQGMVGCQNFWLGRRRVARSLAGQGMVGCQNFWLGRRRVARSLAGQGMVDCFSWRMCLCVGPMATVTPRLAGSSICCTSATPTLSASSFASAKNLAGLCRRKLNLALNPECIPNLTSRTKVESRSSLMAPIMTNPMSKTGMNRLAPRWKIAVGANVRVCRSLTQGMGSSDG